MVSNARDDLPEPDSPVITVSLSRGMRTSTFLRLCSRAPRTWMALCGSTRATSACALIGLRSRRRDSPAIRKNLLVLEMFHFYMARLSVIGKVHPATLEDHNGSPLGQVAWRMGLAGSARVSRDGL